MKIVGAIRVVRISIRLVLPVNSLCIKWLSEQFYPDADDIQTPFGKIRGY